MARIFITGSADGIGFASASLLISRGHRVTLHARNVDRAAQVHKALPGAEGVLIGDLSDLASTRKLAADANAAGPWDAIVHNAGLGPSQEFVKTVDGFASLFQVNSLAPYVLTCLMEQPRRLLYVSSSLHMGGDNSLRDVEWSSGRSWNAFQAYSDTKLHNVLLANAVARAWPDVQSCSLDPGWVKTKLGGSGAPNTTAASSKAIADFAAGTSELVGDRTGVYFNPQGIKIPHTGATNQAKQQEYLAVCERLSNTRLS